MHDHDHAATRTAAAKAHRRDAARTHEAEAALMRRGKGTRDPRTLGARPTPQAAHDQCTDDTHQDEHH